MSGCWSWKRRRSPTRSNQIELTPEQVKQIEQANPCFKERHVESSRPGALLCQDTFFVGQFKGVGKAGLSLQARQVCCC